jgi:hypothetical protein
LKKLSLSNNDQLDNTHNGKIKVVNNTKHIEIPSTAISYLKGIFSYITHFHPQSATWNLLVHLLNSKNNNIDDNKSIQVVTNPVYLILFLFCGKKKINNEPTKGNTKTEQ